MDDLPEPLVSADVDLRNYPYTPLFRARLFGSTFHAHASDGEWRAGVTLWLKSWDQMPAGSLPDNEVDLCRLAELGRDLKSWNKVRDGAMHGWFKCADGRLYHRVVAEGINEAWNSKAAQRDRTAAARAARLLQRLSQTMPQKPEEDQLNHAEDYKPVADCGAPEAAQLSPQNLYASTELGGTIPIAKPSTKSTTRPSVTECVTDSVEPLSHHPTKLNLTEKKESKEDSPPLPTVALPPAGGADACDDNPEGIKNGHSRGSRLPVDWQPSADDREFARKLNVDPDEVAAEFRDYWQSLPGAKARKLDWSAVYHNRCRDIASRARNGPGGDRRGTPSLLRAAGLAFGNMRLDDC